MRDAEIEAVYRQYAVPLKKYAMSLCHDETLAEDFTADAFLRALRDPNGCGANRVFPWLCRIVRNRWIDHLRRRERQNVPLDEAPEVAEPSLPVEERAIQSEERLALYRAIGRLSPLWRDVVYLRAFAGLTFREIGEVLGQSEVWARVTFYRCRMQLKGWMQDETDAFL